ncbi:transglutaminase domain-containing protein [Numidum massiliense]|uniref:transglutaminase domain-containing protein n=1 Tax=Numidum massiliense TaxID=1522315 RepID=UPI0006D55470|nr:transglutaminase-like domain-containing protein [Numidum massiliense]
MQKLLLSLSLLVVGALLAMTGCGVLGQAIDEEVNGSKEPAAGEKLTAAMRTPGNAIKRSTEIPLKYGEGVYDLKVLVPHLSRKNRYAEAAELFVENFYYGQKKIAFFRPYYEQKFHLYEPATNGTFTGEKARVSGSLELSVPENRAVEQLVVTTRKADKDNLEASYLIPVKNGTFDGEYWLRFGPGEYDVTLSVPLNPDTKKEYFEFASVARFTVFSSARDRRHLMPSRGIQSTAPPIDKLARDLTKGKKGARAKAKAIYEYVAKTVAYDVKKLEDDSFSLDDSALKTLRRKSGVCQDYAFLTVALLRAANVEARYVGGVADGERHAWVEAKVDGNWLTMDPTWGAGYVQEGAFVRQYSDDYFDPDPAQFKRTHKREEALY